jgi:hypothetical protein
VDRLEGWPCARKMSAKEKPVIQIQVPRAFVHDLSLQARDPIVDEEHVELSNDLPASGYYHLLD